MASHPNAGHWVKRTLSVTSFFEELKRRNVVRVGIAYGVTAWVLLQVSDLVLDDNVGLCEALSVQ
jgi:hypothetical protein